MLYKRLFKAAGHSLNLDTLATDLNQLLEHSTAATDPLVFGALLSAFQSSLKPGKAISQLRIEPVLKSIALVDGFPPHSRVRFTTILCKISRITKSEAVFLACLDILDQLINKEEAVDLAFRKLLRMDSAGLDPHHDLLGFVDSNFLTAPVRILFIQVFYALIHALLLSHQAVKERASQLCASFSAKFGLAMDDLRPLYHLIFIDDEKLYFECIRLSLGLPSELLPAALNPIHFYQDLIVDVNYNAGIFCERWLKKNPDSLLFCLHLYKYSSTLPSRKVVLENPAKFKAFHLDLVGEVITRLPSLCNPKPLLRALSAFLSQLDQIQR